MLDIINTVRALDLIRQDELDSIKYYVSRGYTLEDAVDAAGVFLFDLNDYELDYIYGEDD